MFKIRIQKRSPVGNKEVFYRIFYMKYKKMSIQNKNEHLFVYVILLTVCSGSGITAWIAAITGITTSVTRIIITRI